jgi:tRNA A-37 threonylcarbamoyl transferase component Bud32
VTARPDPLVGTELGSYRIERVIGHGGMGVVYLATHVGLDRKVALKLLAHDYADDEAFRARFLRESRMAAAIDHPNIIPVYEAGEVDGAYFLAMRYVSGTDLESRLRAGPLDLHEAIHVLGQVASALDAAHEQGLVHRDVKPANVLLAPGQGADRADHAYLTDFGLTKHRGSQSGLTHGSAFIGTLDYIAPEQIEGRLVDGRTDEYGLACVAFECLTGRVPFIRDTDIAIAMAHLRDDPPSAAALRPEIPAEADAVLARGMAKHPDDRYPTCEDFVVALRDALGVQPPEQRRTVPTARHEIVPTNHGEPVPAAGGRTRRVAVGLAAVLLVAVAAIVLGAWGAGRWAAPSPSATPASPAGSASAASASPAFASSAGPTIPAFGEPTEAFPSAAEQALLRAVSAIPGGFSKTCVRGSYKVVGMRDYIRMATPVASLECSPDVTTTGGSEIAVKKFLPETVKIHFVQDFIADLALAPGAQRPITVIPAGDCADGSPAIGSWNIAGEVRGSIACYIDKATGDALLYWSFDEEAVLVRARNRRGDAAALYSFFDEYARFITP